MKYKITVLVLWLISIVTTAILVSGKDVFTYLGPIYAICMIGSVMTVHWARESREK